MGRQSTASADVVAVTGHRLYQRRNRLWHKLFRCYHGHTSGQQARAFLPFEAPSGITAGARTTLRSHSEP